MKRFSVALVAVAICTFVVANASAEANLALRGIGVKAGLVDPEDVDMTLGFGLIFDLGTVHPKVALESYAGYWSQTEEAFGVEYGVRDIAFGAKGKYLFATTNPTIQPFVGTGLGFHVLKAHAETAPISFGGTILYPATSVSNTEIKLGLDIGAGLRIDTGSRFAFIGDCWYTINEVGHLSLMAGAVYMFGR